MRNILIVLLLTIASNVCSGTNVKSDSSSNVLIGTAHPDDWEYTMGGTAYLLKDKYSIHIVIASKGERGLSEKSSKKTAEIRVREAQCAADMVNGTLLFLDKLDGEIYTDEDAAKKLVKLLNELQPEIIFVHWPIDKPDHSAAGNMAHIALSRTGMIYDHEICFFDAGHLTTSTQLTPQIFVNTISVWKYKQKLVRCHACQKKDDILVKEAEKTDCMYGAINRTEYAEGFIPEYNFTSGRWDSNKKIRCSLFDL
jgi:LmbE family N-acetylglucosaminyl deacetylase